MAHKEQVEYCLSVKEKFPVRFVGARVLDCGSLDINGNNRYLFKESDYIGIDVGEGDNVDIVSPIHEFDYPDESFDVIVSTECFEHDMFYKESLANIVRLLKSGGLFFFTCATKGRKEHGTVRTKTKISSPLTYEMADWGFYYKNLSEEHIRDAIAVDEIFKDYEFSVNKVHKDLYFWGIKR
jgi:SAM-dependent methyltransferase